MSINLSKKGSIGTSEIIKIEIIIHTPTVHFYSKPFDKMLGTFYLYQNIFATTVTASDQYMSIQLLEGKSLADKSFEFVLD